MSGFKGIAKGGWHPKGKDGKKESFRGDFKGINTVAGWMGKGKGPAGETEGDEHISRPLATLKDPSAFAPPPKNINYHGAAAMPDRITPDTRGLGAPLSKDELRAKQEAKVQAEREAEEAEKRKGPPVPFRANTSGLSTSHLPPPPGRTDGADGRSPATPAVGAKPKPSLPPRLPPRQTTSSPAPPPPYKASTEPEAHKGVLNQGALGRLGAAGVSVPGFEIGGHPKSPLPPPVSSRSSAPETAPAGKSSQFNEISSRFSRLPSSISPKPEATSQGTTWAQKQAALKTASSFREDPSKVSLNDARAAASTANNFRERHGEQVKSGWQSANKLNTKYGIADKVSSYSDGGTAQVVESPHMPIDTRDNSQVEQANGRQDYGVAGKKKPPPPPPTKKAALVSSTSVNGVALGPLPPPISLANKPKPQVSG